MCVDEENLQRLARGHGGYNSRMKRVCYLKRVKISFSGYCVGCCEFMATGRVYKYRHDFVMCAVKCVDAVVSVHWFARNGS